MRGLSDRSPPRSKAVSSRAPGYMLGTKLMSGRYFSLQVLFSDGLRKASQAMGELAPVKLRGFRRKPQKPRPLRCCPRGLLACASAHSYTVCCSGDWVMKVLLHLINLVQPIYFRWEKMVHVPFFSHFQNRKNSFLNKITLVPGRQLMTQSLALAVLLEHSKRRRKGLKF